MRVSLGRSRSSVTSSRGRYQRGGSPVSKSASGPGTVREHLAVEPTPARGASCEDVDAVVRVARVDDRRLVLLEPLVERVQVEGEVARERRRMPAIGSG